MSETEERRRAEAEADWDVGIAGTRECGNTGMREWRWGVIYFPSHKTFDITEYSAFYQNSPRLVASGLTYGEAVAMCTLMNAGGSDVGG